MGIPFAWLKAPIAWKRGPLIAPDANTVALVYWRGGALVDSQGNAWAAQGTVPQVAASGKTPPGAGPFSDANYYSLGTGSDVLDFAGDFSACVVFRPASLANNPALVSNGVSATAGYLAQISSTYSRFFRYNGTQYYRETGAPSTTALNVYCFGQASGFSYSKLNLGAVNVGGVTFAMTPATSNVARLGRYDGAGLAFNGTIYEVWFSTTTPSDALFTDIAQSVRAKVGISEW